MKILFWGFKVKKKKKKKIEKASRLRDQGGTFGHQMIPFSTPLSSNTSRGFETSFLISLEHF